MSRAALRASSANFPYMLLMLRADLELGRGDFEAARAHLDAAEPRSVRTADKVSTTSSSPIWPCGNGAGQTPTGQCKTGWRARRSRQAAQLHIWFCAKGLRAQAELAALARARRDTEAARAWLAKAQKLLAVARRSAQEASAVTPNAAGWLALAEAEYERAQGTARARIVVGGRCRLGAARPDAPRGLLPLARGRGARRRRRLPHRGEQTAQAGARRRRSHRRAAAAARTRPPRPARPARPQPVRECATRPSTRPAAVARPHPTRGRGTQPRRPRLHQPRDRRRTRHQRQDRQRPRLAHPAKARRAQQTRGRRDRAPPIRPARTRIPSGANENRPAGSSGRPPRNRPQHSLDPSRGGGGRGGRATSVLPSRMSSSPPHEQRAGGAGQLKVRP